MCGYGCAGQGAMRRNGCSCCCAGTAQSQRADYKSAIRKARWNAELSGGGRERCSVGRFLSPPWVYSNARRAADAARLDPPKVVPALRHSSAWPQKSFSPPASFTSAAARAVVTRSAGMSLHEALLRFDPRAVPGVACAPGRCGEIHRRARFRSPWRCL